MSAYNGRRGPNVSAYVANLNTVVPDEVLESNPDFSMFLDTDLFDRYDPSNLDFTPPLDVDLASIETPAPATQASRTLPVASATDDKMDFNLNGKQFSRLVVYLHGRSWPCRSLPCPGL
jgi:hypothetical protein